MEATEQILERLKAIEENQTKIMHALGIGEEWKMNFIKLLPAKLQHVNKRALKMALESEMITVTSRKTLAHHFRSKTLLAYFCGRAWAGDMPMHEFGNLYVWKLGTRKFDGEPLNGLFETTNLKQIREKGRGGQLPEGHELVDEWFD